MAQFLTANNNELLKADGGRTVREVTASLRGCPEPKAGKIAAAFRGRQARTLNRAEADQLLSAAREMAKPVKPLARSGRSPFTSPGGIRPQFRHRFDRFVSQCDRGSSSTCRRSMGRNGRKNERPALRESHSNHR